MPESQIDLDAYCERIAYRGDRAPSLRTLQRLHALHPAAIPFENLSPLLGMEVALDAAALEDKLIAGGRGGYCYEHNLLFAHALRALGFEVAGLAARVRWNAPADVVTPRTHMLLLVRHEGVRYIADVGFGGLTLTAPLRLEPGVEQATPHEPFRLVAAGAGHVLEAKLGDAWKTLYTFDLQEQQLPDYQLASWYLSHHPRSPFVNSLIAARAEADRRHALLDNRYTVHHADGSSESRLLASGAQLQETLEQVFRIRLPDHPGLVHKLAEIVRASSQSNP